MEGIKGVLENGEAIVVCDTNVYLNIYLYSPEYANYSIKCLNAIKEYLFMPSVVEVEFLINYDLCYKKMSSRVKNAYKNAIQQLSRVQNECLLICMNLKKLGFEEIDELYESIDYQCQLMSKKVDSYFSNRKQVIELLENGWEKTDYVYDIYKCIGQNGHVFPPYSLQNIYYLCEQGRKRYIKKIPPGYKDSKKDGINKYGDFIWWKEVINYAKKQQVDIFIVTDDVKGDWWIRKNNNYIFREELRQEFEKKTGNRLYAYTSLQFFELIKNTYGIEKPDMLQYALELTDENYCKRISDKVFEQISEVLVYNGMDYIVTDSAHINDIGLDEFEIISYEYMNGMQTAREYDDVYYVLEYAIVISGYSYEYWGKDDDSKEIICSPANYHEFEGIIQVSLKRKADYYVDFENEDSFDEPEVVDGHLEETYYRPWY